MVRHRGYSQAAKSAGRSKSGEKIDFAAYRAGFLRSGVSPLLVGEMSLYELLSTANALAIMNEDSPKTGQKLPHREVNDDEWAQAMSLMAGIAAVDPNLKM